jgi:hypothetical protein
VLVKALTEAVELTKRLRRASPKTGERRSLRKISAELAAAGNLNERGQPFNPNSVRLMLESCAAGVPQRRACPWNAGAVWPTLCSRNSS